MEKVKSVCSFPVMAVMFSQEGIVLGELFDKYLNSIADTKEKNNPPVKEEVDKSDVKAESATEKEKDGDKPAPKQATPAKTSGKLQSL